MLNFNTDHKALVWTMFSVFFALTLGVAIYPAFQMDNGYEPLPSQSEMTQQEIRGQEIFIAEGCVACHTQQVRNIEMDKTWGERPALPEDYYYSKQRMGIWRQTPSTLGSERTGPDLTDVGKRQPLNSWHLLHLYEPRAVSKNSIMPSYRWFFDEVDEQFVDPSDVVVSAPKKYKEDPNKKIIATREALDLVAYLTSLKQPELPEDREAPEFIPLSKKDKNMVNSGGDSGSSSGVNGKNLFASTCASCHQSSGKGVPGAFPPLSGSGIVNLKNPKDAIKIVLQGRNVLPDYAAMPPFGDQLSDEEVAAILTYDRSSWGNDAPPVKPATVEKIRAQLEKEKSK